MPTTTVYCLYGADGSLLYVGVTNQRAGRFRQHTEEKLWWTEVACAQFERYPTRSLAEKRERDLIVGEQPRYNVVLALPEVFKITASAGESQPLGNWLTIDDVATRLGVHRQSVKRWIQSRVLRATNLGHCGYRIARAELDGFMERRATTPAEQKAG